MESCNNKCGNNHYLRPLHMIPPLHEIPEVFGRELTYYERVNKVECKVNEQINFINTQLDCLIAEHVALIKLAGDYTPERENLRLFLQSRCEDIKDANAGIRTKSAEFVVDFKGDVGEFKSKIYDFVGIGVSVNQNTINLQLPGGQYIVYVDITGNKNEALVFSYNNGIETEYRKEIDAGYASPFSFTAKGNQKTFMKLEGNTLEIRVKFSLIKIGG